MNVDAIKFRMYNTGSVGDCLLLLFMKGEEISFKMLVDCGGYNTNSALVTPAVEDIRKVCDGKLDLLVVTHQHEDHISGFNQARAVFDQIEVKDVWMSWIEDKTDPIGKLLKDKYGKKLKALRKTTEKALKKFNGMAGREYAVAGMKQKFGKKQARAQHAMELIEFEEGENYGRKLGAGKQTNADAMEYVRKKGMINYWKPGTVVKDLEGAEGMKFFILGPPRDADMKFFKIVMKEEEMYKLAASSPSVEEAIDPDNRIVTSGIILEENVSPFGAEFDMSAHDKTEWFKKYDSHDLKWRQIETDWLESDAGIAMRVTNLTNNTSLAMAIEFSNGQVILLPGDAQSGNWMGWHKPDVVSDLMKNGGKSTEDLLKNTVFYKVGHHASHNGTATISGLEKTNTKDLVAAIPLIASKIPEAWGADNFPAKGLYRELIKKTNGRIIRTDEGIAKDNRAKKLRDALPAKAKTTFEKGFKKGTTFVEYTIRTES